MDVYFIIYLGNILNIIGSLFVFKLKFFLVINK